MWRSDKADARDAGGPDCSRIQQIFDNAQRHYQADRLAEAEQLLLQILRLDRSHAMSWYLLGVICYRTGRYVKSSKWISNAIMINGEVAGFYCDLGNALCAQGKLDDAAASYQRALALKPDLAEVHNGLGYTRDAQGRYEEAIVHCKQALALRPDYANAHNNLGKAFHGLGKFDDAAVHYETALALEPDNAAFHNNFGSVLHAQGRLDDAIAHYEHALAIKPDCAVTHSNWGNALVALGRAGDAVVQFEQALDLEPGFAECHYNMANALQALGHLDDAVAGYERALILKPDFAEACSNLGNVLRDQGKLADALAQYQRALTLKPDFAEAYAHYASLKRFHAGDAELKALERLAADPDRIPAQKAVYIYCALAKALEDVGEYDQAFQHLLKGNALKRQEVDYDEAGIEALFKRLPEIFDEHLFDRFQGLGDPSQVPVFIVGMPRSGSTLIEQILASHPEVLGGGELSDFGAVTNRISGPDSQTVRYPEYVPALDRIMIRCLGREYLAQLPALGTGQVRITDKLLFNFLHIGLIHLIFPNAKIIHIMREPADTCVSCFATLFVDNMLNFSYDLGELGRYYRRYMALMAHWRSVLPPDTIFDVSYEELVDDIEEQAQRLIAYCGLPWVDRCLSFHETKRTVSTASAAQVRQPLFRSSIKRWKRFEAYLQPLLAELGDPGCEGILN